MTLRYMTNVNLDNEWGTIADGTGIEATTDGGYRVFAKTDGAGNSDIQAFLADASQQWRTEDDSSNPIFPFLVQFKYRKNSATDFPTAGNASRANIFQIGSAVGVNLNVQDTVSAAGALAMGMRFGSKGANGTIVSSTISLSADTDYVVRVYVCNSPALYRLEIFNSSYVSVGSSQLSGTDLSITDPKQIDYGLLQAGTGSVADEGNAVRLKDIVMIDGTAGEYTNFIWPYSCYHVQSSFTESGTIEFTPSTGTDNAANIDEWPYTNADWNESPDDTSDVKDLFNIPTYSAPSTGWRPRAIAMQVLKGNDTDGILDTHHFGTLYDGSNYDHLSLWRSTASTTDGQPMSVIWERAPDGEPWNVDKYDALDVGYSRVSAPADRIARIYTMFITVIESGPASLIMPHPIYRLGLNKR